MTGTASTGPEAVYRQRLEERRSEVARLQRRHLVLSNTRLALFFAGATLAWLAWVSHRISGWWVAVLALAFIVVAAAHDRVLQRRRRQARAVRFYARGLERLQGKWTGQGTDGLALASTEHAYAHDLDLFGRGSLFQLLCTARTRGGRRMLAHWLMHPAPPQTVRARQQAVDELRPRLDLREDLALLSHEVDAEVHPRLLEEWSSAPPVLFRRRPQVFVLAANGLTMFSLVAWGLGWFPGYGVIVAGAVQATLVRLLRRQVHQVVEGVEEPGRELFLLAQVLERLSREDYTSPLLAGRRRRLETGEGAPHQAIAALAGLVERLDWRRNNFFAPLAMLTSWSTHLAFALEAWRRRHGSQVSGWLESIGEMEALSALAGYAFEHPTDPFPEVVEDGEPFLEGEGLAHPLLQEGECVRNDLKLGRGLQLLIVSGSNMSGKSTLLRTLGMNVVLAQAGAPVRARRLRLSPLALGASIRVHDSLQEGRSRFYAEITRLRLIMEKAEQRPPVLFLLDEILHGTNSHDRRLGAEAVVRGLLQRGALGLVTTHDLALAQVAEALAPRAGNIHFQDTMVDGRMHFDYRIHHGVVERSNALDLMRSVGLDV